MHCIIVDVVIVVVVVQILVEVRRVNGDGVFKRCEMIMSCKCIYIYPLIAVVDQFARL